MATPNYYREERPWGSFERFTDNEVSTIKLLHIESGKRFSLQRHVHRTEFWRVVQGGGILTVGSETRAFNLGDEILVPVGELHRLEGGLSGMTVLEIITGAYDESDIQRIEDDFGRK